MFSIWCFYLACTKLSEIKHILYQHFVIDMSNSEMSCFYLQDGVGDNTAVASEYEIIIVLNIPAKLFPIQYHCIIYEYILCMCSVLHCIRPYLHSVV